MPSSPQVLATVVVFDYELTPDAQVLANAEILVWLSYDLGTAISPLLNLESKRLRIVTDANGYWQLNLVPNNNINPANTVYNVRTPYRTYQIIVPSGGGPYQSSSLATVSPPAQLPAGPFAPFAVLYAGAGGAAAGASFATWTPTVTPHGSMTMTPGAHVSNHARYLQVGKLVVMSYSQLFTFGGVASDGADFTLPVTARDNRGQFSGSIANVLGFVECGDVATFLTVLRYDAANIGLSNWHVAFNGVYEAA